MQRFANTLQSYYIFFTSLLLIAITALSLFPLPELPKVPGNDKTHHLLAYATLAFPVSYVKPKHYLWVLFSFLLWSGLIEMIQPYVNRYGEWLDLLANGCGIIIGFLVGRIASRLIS
ncbi:MAG: hypothetical protein MUE95_05020 [Cyclobacteriaceae bacterium]|jgi:VanZ family protein|nr:hypothetical protein [Cyclobacteriaceae bacterium]